MRTAALSIRIGDDRSLMMQMDLEQEKARGGMPFWHLAVLGAVLS
ncbi:MAG TPA: hypothetical protein VG894_13160 [Bauldia sp.]|nr:hypothetical protein [Bauldia sp.]